MDDHAQRSECTKEFDRLWGAMREMENEQGSQALTLARVETNIANLVKSMDGLTKALWGMVVSVATIGAAFIVWYIQTGRV